MRRFFRSRDQARYSWPSSKDTSGNAPRDGGSALQRNIDPWPYEQAFAVIQKLNLGHEALREMFRRMLFNVLARNQDDHTRNIAFLMDRAGQWRLAPAFDVIWAYNPAGGWTSRHQMSLNGKRDNFTRADLLTVAEQFGLKRATELIATVGMAVANWIKFAQDAKVDGALSKTIALSHRLNLMG